MFSEIQAIILILKKWKRNPSLKIKDFGIYYIAEKDKLIKDYLKLN